MKRFFIFCSKHVHIKFSTFLQLLVLLLYLLELLFFFEKFAAEVKVLVVNQNEVVLEQIQPLAYRCYYLIAEM